MRRNIRLWILVCLTLWIIASVAFAAVTLTVSENQDFVFLMKAIFVGYGLSCFLLISAGVAGLYFMDKLKQISLTGWRLFIFSFTAFSAIVLPRIGNSFVVVDEGWLSLYKHPLVWILITLLIGNAVLYLFKGNNSTKVP